MGEHCHLAHINFKYNEILLLEIYQYKYSIWKYLQGLVTLDYSHKKLTYYKKCELININSIETKLLWVSN
jgi:hypothetical protein